MAKQNYGGVYANMEFPPYTYIPYPRHIITGPDGLYEVANSEEEEKKIKARLHNEYENAPAYEEPLTVDPEKEILISRARELSVPINRKWSKQKLEQVVRQAESAIDDLPPEDHDDSDDSAQASLFELPLSLTPAASSLHAVSSFEETPEVEEDKDALIAEAKSLGIPATKLWGIPRLKQSIAEATSK